MKIRKEFTVSNIFGLKLQNLSMANVKVVVGKDHTVKVKIDGHVLLVSKITVAQISNTQINITGSSFDAPSFDNTGKKAKKDVQISIQVPLGTNLNIYNVKKASVRGLGGGITANLSNQNSFEAIMIHDVTLSCNDQSSANLQRVTGYLDLIGRDNSVTEIQGQFVDITVSTSGQSSVILSGICNNITAHSRDFSSIHKSGASLGKVVKNEFGSSSITI